MAFFWNFQSLNDYFLLWRTLKTPIWSRGDACYLIHMHFSIKIGTEIAKKDKETTVWHSNSLTELNLGEINLFDKNVDELCDHRPVTTPWKNFLQFVFFLSCRWWCDNFLEFTLTSYSANWKATILSVSTVINLVDLCLLRRGTRMRCIPLFTVIFDLSKKIPSKRKVPLSSLTWGKCCKIIYRILVL